MKNYRKTEDPNILQCEDTGTWIPRGHRDWPTEWLLTNEPLPIRPLYELGTPAHYQAIRAAAWDWMSSVVKARRYDSIESCCSYANSTVPRYKAEALAMISWRDAINTTLEQLVMNPPPGLETWEQVKALLPQPEAFNWPAEVDIPMDNETVQLP